MRFIYQGVSYINKTTFRFQDDVERIYNLLTSKGVDTDLLTSEYLWIVYSEYYCASWLGLPKNDEELFNILIETAKQIKHRL